jgi:hypothetical protein
MAGGRPGAAGLPAWLSAVKCARGLPPHESIFECDARLSVGLVTLIEWWRVRE